MGIVPPHLYNTIYCSSISVFILHCRDRSSNDCSIFRATWNTWRNVELVFGMCKPKRSTHMSLGDKTLDEII